MKKIIGLELLLILFFTLNGFIQSKSAVHHPLFDYIGVLPLALGIAVVVWKKGRTGFRSAFQLESIPFLFILALLIVSNEPDLSLFDSHLWMVAGSQLFIVAFVEEWVFRGFILQSLMKRGVKIAVIGSSGLFAFTHLLQALNGRSAEELVVQIGYAFLVGVVLSLWVIRHHSLWVPIVFHGMNNTILMRATEEGNVFYTVGLIALLLVFAVLLASKQKRHPL